MRTEVPFDYIGEAHRSSNVYLGESVIKMGGGCDTIWFLNEPEEQLLVEHSPLWD